MSVVEIYCNTHGCKIGEGEVDAHKVSPVYVDTCPKCLMETSADAVRGVLEKAERKVVR